MIFENDGQQDFFEVILDDEELDNLKQGKGVVWDFPLGLNGTLALNVFIRPEKLNIEDLCH